MKAKKSIDIIGANLVFSRRTEDGAVPRGACSVPPFHFSIVPHIVKKVNILSKKVKNTQPISRYSAKNNVAIHMIATFMSKYF